MSLTKRRQTDAKKDVKLLQSMFQYMAASGVDMDVADLSGDDAQPELGTIRPRLGDESDMKQTGSGGDTQTKEASL